MEPSRGPIQRLRYSGSEGMTRSNQPSWPMECLKIWIRQQWINEITSMA